MVERRLKRTGLRTCSESRRKHASWPVIRNKRAVGFGFPWYGVAVAWTAVWAQACIAPHADSALATTSWLFVVFDTAGEVLAALVRCLGVEKV
jgi:hypothetical protein